MSFLPLSPVVITGLGLSSAFGVRESTWTAILAGHSAARWLPGDRALAACMHPSRSLSALDHLHLAADEALQDARLNVSCSPLERFPIGGSGVSQGATGRPRPVLSEHGSRTTSGTRSLQEKTALDEPRSTQAVSSTSQIDGSRGYASWDRTRVGTVIGFSKGDVRTLTQSHQHGFPTPTSWPLTWPGGAASALSARFGFQGPCLGPVAACASGVVAVLQAARLIQTGVCDIVLAGAGDSAVEPLVLAALKQMRVLARTEPGSHPARSVRPFDRLRSGFLPGEGAALLVLERADHAQSRGQAPLLELRGGAFGSDAYHLTDLDPDPAHLAGLIERALADSGLKPGQVDLIHPHGTATLHNDRLEALALKRVFGADLDRTACHASKPQIGHLLGASGAAELVLSCLALRDGLVPPTLNRFDPDPELDLPFVSGSAQARPLQTALKLAIGFGGHLAAVVVSRVS